VRRQVVKNQPAATILTSDRAKCQCASVNVMTAKGTPPEDRLTEKIRRYLHQAGSRDARNSNLRVAIGDDAAVWRPRPGYETILTCDWFLEGTHFLADQHPPATVASKSLARAVSDIAAMGGEPRCFLLSLALPARRVGKWLEKFLLALRAAAGTWNCPIAGGDTTRGDHILISITVVGECQRGRMILRNGARPGDAIFVTGRLGEAEYGLQLIKRGWKASLRDPRLKKHLRPAPRLAAGRWLAQRCLATAMMDLSDGLSTDLPRLCKASQVGARIEKRGLPLVRVAGRDRRRLPATELGLHGGDDYELLFTVAPKDLKRIPGKIGQLPVTRIGEITLKRQIVLAGQNGLVRELKNKGWDPFR
jgi:thiamine-monophosphate kinase